VIVSALVWFGVSFAFSGIGLFAGPGLINAAGLLIAMFCCGAGGMAGVAAKALAAERLACAQSICPECAAGYDLDARGMHHVPDSASNPSICKAALILNRSKR
jgi:hypothetical protein